MSKKHAKQIKKLEILVEDLRGDLERFATATGECLALAALVAEQQGDKIKANEGLLEIQAAIDANQNAKLDALYETVTEHVDKGHAPTQYSPSDSSYRRLLEWI